MTRPAAQGRVLLMDARPLEGPTGTRGVGHYVSSLLSGLDQLGSGWSVGLAVGREGKDRGALVRCALPGPDLFWSRLMGPRWVRQTGADLYHATFLAPLRVPRGFPWVSTIHDLIPLRHPRGFTWKQLTTFRMSLRWNARATRVVTVSRFTADLVVRALGADASAVRVVPPPVDVEGLAAAVAAAASEARPFDEPYLLHASGFDPLKGVTDLLLPALASVAGERGELKLVMTGPASAWRERAERAARELGLQDRVVFTGLVSDRERAALLRHASALVVPSREEGFGIPAIEGLAAGLPVVVGPAEATRHALGTHGHLARDDTPAALADAIREALEAPGNDDPAAAESRRAYARGFAPIEIARRMVEVYEEALA